jgi:type IV pilus assembly protein PilW
MAGNNTKGISCSDGLTLVEILVALAVFSIVLAMVVQTFFSQQNALAHIDHRSQMHINARNAMHILENHVQMMGFCPAQGLDSEDAMDFSRGCLAEGGQLVFRRKNPKPGQEHETQTISINLYKADDRQGGGPDGLADDRVGATGLIIHNIRAADDIVAIRFGYAFDGDGDGCLDLSAADHIIWTIDTDDDGRLDTVLDTDDDGDVDRDDAAGGKSLARKVPIGRIRAVRIWLLARSDFPLKGQRDRREFVVGDRRCRVDDYYGHVLLTTTVRCRNMIDG